MKTKDRGSWGAKAMCDDGLDSLVRSYGEARKSGIHAFAVFELWLEGPVAGNRETAIFVENPRRASDSIRKKLLSIGAELEWLDDFLDRLIIEARQPAQGHIDAIVLRQIACIWPALSKTEIDALYSRCLAVVTSAQGAQSQMSVHSCITDSVGNAGQGQLFMLESDSAWGPILPQVLSKSMLTALTPPLPGELAESLVARMGHGEPASLLELKMTTAGARPETIEQAKDLRAQMDIRRHLILASRQSAEDELDRLRQRVLMMANATAKKVELSSVANPVAASRPAEAIAAELLSRPGDLANCDDSGLFGGDGYMIYGFLCHISDLCGYPWRAA